MKTRMITASAGILVLLSSTPLLADGAKGMIISRTGDTLVVKSDGGNVTVVLTDATRTKDNVGLFGMGRQELSNVVLMPGLKVDIDGTADDHGRVIAQTITVDGDDLEAAEMIQSGLHPTAAQVATNVQAIEALGKTTDAHGQQLTTQKGNIEANRTSISAHEQKISKSMKDIQENTDRFMALDDYDVKDKAVVKFKSASSSISSDDEKELMRVAQLASGVNGCFVEVIGYADATGNAQMNTKLSEDRAKAVVAYLVQQGGIPVRRIVAPGAMGEYGAAAPNETAEGRAENRRVEVKVLVNKGIAGQ